MKDHYLTVGQLRQVIQNLPDEAKVYYERIEDVYFNKYGWVSDKLIPVYPDGEADDIKDEYLRAWCAFNRDGDVCITAHY